jgi:formylmethanofuran dehydrogenase subunit B
MVTNEGTTLAERPPTPDRFVADVTCLGCGCLCDDLTVRVDGGTIAAVTPECALGLSWFRFMTDRRRPYAARIDGRDATRDEAIAEAAARLTGAQAPLVLGLSGTTIEAQREAVALADRLGAVVHLDHAADVAPAAAAFQTIGAVGATLGEVKNRADVVVYWGADPDATHPRHASRYAVDPVGRFVPEGRAGRYVVLVAGPAAEVRLPADEVLHIPEASQAAALRVLAALVRGVAPDAAEVEAACGVPLEALARLAGRMKGARYGALFHPGWLWRGSGPVAVEAALRLVRDLNAFTRFVALPMGGPGNPAGAEAVLTWQAGFPHSVDFGSGVPRYRPGEASAEVRLPRRACDALLLVGAGAGDALSAGAWAAMDGIPTVEIAPGASRGVAIDCASPAVAAGGTVLRCDGVTLPLRPVLGSDRPDEATILRRLRAALGTPEAAR